MRYIGDEEAKLLMLEILKDIACYCNENNMHYYLAYGTLLGAIRHNGFIPWDNDIDIWMPRPDYESFRKLVRAKPIASNIRVLDPQIDDTFPFIKVIDSRTILREDYLVTEKNLGVYVDIFALDGLPDDDKIIDQIISKANNLNKAYALASYRFNTGSSKRNKVLKNLFFPFSRILMSRKTINKKLDCLCEGYNYTTSTYVGNLLWPNKKRECLKKEWFKGATHKFEGYDFSIPDGYDKILSHYYGNYMQLPPDEDRVTHCFRAHWR